MQDVLDEFEVRVTEVDQFLKVLQRLENPDVVLYNKSTSREMRVFEEGSLTVMKATVFLLIYNIVESAIRRAFGSVYEQIGRDGSTNRALRVELRKLWIRQQFQKLDGDSASIRTFRELTEEIVEDVAVGKAILLSEKLLPVSGNLDSDAIREVCHRHGVSVKVDRRARGGAELIPVKEQRNALAHGNVSFTECGQQYTVADLERIKKQAVIFVRGILKNVQEYIDQKKYARSPN